MRIAFALSGLHRVQRGAEVAFLSVARSLAQSGHTVTLFGSGPPISGVPYRYVRVPLIARERFERLPAFPAFRDDTAWEEVTFLPGFLRHYCPTDFDVTLACSYPFINWALRARTRRGYRPCHVFVTQNGDWPARASNSEYRFFGCDGLVAINPDYYEANRSTYRTALIPNGADQELFHPGQAKRDTFGLPADRRVVLMVSALIESKRVADGILAVSRLPNVHLAVAGDGPLRDHLRVFAAEKMPGRFHNFTVNADQMPDLYRSVDAFLHLSRDESFGNVFVEAMASGLPTVAWDLSRTRWILGETGTLVPDLDNEALVRGIAHSLTQERASPIQLERSRRFAWQAVAGDYERFLKQVVASGQKSPLRTS